MKSNDVPVKEIEFNKKNFYILDAQRSYIQDSYDFIIETIGPYENREIEGSTKFNKLEKDIELRNVSFDYPGRTNTLNNINLLVSLYVSIILYIKNMNFERLLNKLLVAYVF